MRTLLALFFGLAALGQTVTFEVEAIGHGPTTRLVRIDATDVPALEVLSRAAGVTETRLRVDPALIEDLSTRTVTVRRDRIVLDELALLLGLRLGLRVAVHDGAITVQPGGRPADLLRVQALVHVDHALVGHADPQLMAALRYHRACLLMESGAAASAAPAFADVAADFPGNAVASDARTFSLAAALRAGRAVEAVGLLAAIEGSAEGLPPIPGAELLPARVYAAAGQHTEALIRARRVATSGRFVRDRALAALLAAEIQYRCGDGAGMLASLALLPNGFDRECRDLVPKHALARGLALRLLGDPSGALVHLRVAFRSIDIKGKPDVACAIAECLADLDQPVPAWIAVRHAEDLEQDPGEARRFRARRAELEEAIGSVGMAAETCAGILETATGPFPEAERVLATLTRSLLATGKDSDARRILEALADRGAWRGWALYNLANLERKSGNLERAIRALARVEEKDLGAPGPTADDVRTLRGRLLIEVGDPLQAAEVFRGTPQAEETR